MDSATAVQATDSKLLIDQLIKEAKPVQDTIEVKGITFKAITDHQAWSSALAKAKLFAQTCKKKLVPEEYKPFLINDAKIQIECAMLGEMSVSPKIGELEFMRLAFEAPLLFRGIVEEWDNNNRGRLADAEEEGIEEAKKDLATAVTDQG